MAQFFLNQEYILEILILLLQSQNTMENGKRQRIFQSLFNMTYEPVIVDKKGNLNQSKKPYTTIFDAINHADESVVIKVMPGIYNERIQVKKKNLKLQVAQISQHSILINQQYPTIMVDLPQQTDKIVLEWFKIVNTCENNSRQQTLNGSYQSMKKHEYLNLKTSSSMNTCIYIKKGIVQLEQCKLSMASFNNKHITLPCIIVQEKGGLIINRSQIIGGIGTIGIVSRGGSIIIKESIIKNHGVAGILISKRNSSKNITIKNSEILRCNEGLVLNGNFNAHVESNSFRQCLFSSIVVCNGNNSIIVNNQIRQSRIGIQILNSYADISKNTIVACKQNGIYSKSTRGVLCKPSIKLNIIKQNENGGIIVQGSMNKSKIMGNQLNYNNEFGIKVTKRSSPHIFTNKIHNTLGNGVYVCSNSFVFLQKNEIDGSTKCNIVLQGPNNVGNFIYRNKIKNGRGEGIFCVYGGKYTIKQNEISENYNGIVSLSGVETIEQNRIFQNERNGILLIGDNNNLISQNQIEENKKSGIFIRNSSIAKIQQNYFSKNSTEVVIQKNHPFFQKIEENNIFQQESYDIRIPSNYKCQLI